MKAICTQENLRNALFALERMIGKQSSLPILSNILIETNEGQLKFSATNLEIGGVVRIGAKIEKEGKITLPGKFLSLFIQNLPEGKVVELSQEGLHLTLKSEPHEVKIKGLDPKDFPIIPEFHGEYHLTLSTPSLREALQKVLFCVSLNEARMELTGVYILFLEDRIAFAATDSFRLGEYELLLEKGEVMKEYTSFRDQNPSLLIPAATLQETLRIIGPTTNKTVSLAVKENQLFIESGGVQIISRLINGRYPDYKQIIPKSFTHTLSIKKDEYLRALKMSMSFSMYSAGEVTLAFNPKSQEVTVISQSQEIGENRTTLPFEGTIDEKVEMVFNPRYLLEGGAILQGEKIHFSFNTPTTPILLQETTETHSLYIVMPIRK